MYEEKYELNWSKVKNALVRYKKTGIVAGLLVASTVVFGNKTIFPEKYEASALVRVKVSEALRNEGAARGDMIRVVQEEILSRTVLESVAKQLGMDQPYSGQKTAVQYVVELVTGRETAVKPYSMDNIVRDLRTNVQVVETVTSAGGTNVFMISMQDRDPEAVANTVNAIVNTYIDHKSTFKASDSHLAVEFLTKQVEAKKQDLMVVTKKLEMYKGANSKFLTTEAALGQSIHDGRMRIVAAEARLAQADAMISNTQEALQATPANVTMATAARPADLANLTPGERLVFMEQQLVDYQTRYTADHPDVIRTQREIEQLKRVLGSRTSNDVTTTVVSSSNPEYLRLRNDLSVARAGRQSALSEIALIRREVADLESTLAKLPQVQQILNPLENARDNIQREYQELQTRLTGVLLTSQAAETSVGSDYTVIDSAATPTTPTVRSRLTLHLFGIFLGIGTGIGLSLLLGLTMPGDKMHIEIGEDGDVNVKDTNTASMWFYIAASAMALSIIGYVVVNFLTQMVVFV